MLFKGREEIPITDLGFVSAYILGSVIINGIHNILSHLTFCSIIFSVRKIWKENRNSDLEREQKFDAATVCGHSCYLDGHYLLTEH